MDEIMIMPLELSDLDAVVRLEESNFTTPWSKDDFAELIDKPDRGCIVAKAGDKVVGCVVYRNIVGDVDITNVSVDEGYRRRGIARRLMDEAVERAGRIGGERFTLEVRASNLAAVNLYEGCGFVREGVRKNFYEHPREDALIMWKYSQGQA